MCVFGRNVKTTFVWVSGAYKNEIKSIFMGNVETKMGGKELYTCVKLYPLISGQDSELLKAYLSCQVYSCS